MDQLTQLVQVFAPLTAIFISIPFIQAIVNMAKTSGLPSKYAAWVAVAIGGFLGAATSYLVLALLTVSFPPAIVYIYGVFMGLQTGASAAGFYDAAKFSSITSTEPTIITDETGSANISAILLIALIGLFIYLIYIVSPINVIYIYIMGSCALVGYFIGLLSRFKYTKCLEKQLISARLEKI